MHFPKVFPPNGFKDGITTVQHQQLERVDSHVAKAVNGDDGGLWVPAQLAQDTSAWVFSKASVGVQNTLQVDADSGKNATYFVDTTDNTQHNFFRRIPNLITGVTYVFSTFAKKFPVRYIWFGQDGPNYVYFDLQGGVVGTLGGSGTGAITSVGNGWYYCTATLPGFTTDRAFLGISTNNGSATYAGAGTGVLLYKTFVDLETDSRKKRPVVIGGAGIQPTLAPLKNPLFGEPGGVRSVTRIIGALPATLKSGGALPTSGDQIEGQASGAAAGLMADRQLFLNDLPDGATVVSVTAYIKVSSTLRSPLPATLPTFSVLRTSVSSGAEQELRAAGRVTFVVGGQGIPDNYIVPPAGPNVYPTTGGLGAIQQWTYTADQMNPVDRTTYFYSIRIYDETGGTATPGNTYSGFKITYVIPDHRVA